MQTWPGRKRNRSRRVVCLADFWAVDAPNELLAAAVDITRAASGLAAQRFLEGVPVSTKADDTEVTPADIEVEELIRSLIAARFPSDGVTGVELEDTPGTTGHRWVIDPIDGTSGFARYRRLLNVRPSSGSHLPPSANARAAVISDNQPQSLKRLKFLQDGPLAWAISRINRQVYPPSVPVPTPLGDDRQEFDLTIGKRSVTHGASPG